MRTPIFNIPMPPPLKSALTAHCRQHGMNLSDFIRRTAAAAVGRPDLATPMKSGPRKGEKRLAKAS